jgi:MFS family permease
VASELRVGRAARVVLAGQGVNAFGIGLVLPFLLVYLHQVRGIPLQTTGLLLAIPGLVGFSLGPLAGTASDRLGAKRVLVGGSAVSGLSSLLLPLVHGPAAAVPVLLLVGIGFAVFFTSQTGLLALLAGGPVLDRLYALDFVLLNAGIGVGGLVAGAVVSVRHPGTFVIVYLVDGLTSLAYAALVSRVRVPRRAPRSERRAGSYHEVVQETLFRRLFAVALLLALVGYAQVDGGLPALVTVTLALPPRSIAAALVANTAVIVVGQLLVQRRIARWRRTRALMATAGIWAVAWTGLGLAAAIGPHVARWVVVIGFGCVFGLGETFMAPTVSSMISAVAPEHLRGRYLASSALTFSLGTTLAPPLATALIGRHLAGLWVGILVAGCGLVVLAARGLERRLTPVQNGTAAASPEPETAIV